MCRRIYEALPFGLLAALFVAPVVAAPLQSTSQVTNDNRSVTDLAPVAVSSALLGPALWKVTKDGHVMWVLGVTDPLPKKMQWETVAIERAVGNSQAVLKQPRLEVGARVRFWGRLFLIPSMIGIKKMPNDETLHDVLSPELYLRWEVQRGKYLGGPRSTDRLRPIYWSNVRHCPRHTFDAATDVQSLRAELERRLSVSPQLLRLAPALRELVDAT